MIADPSALPEWWHEPRNPSCRYGFPTGIPGVRVMAEGNPEQGYQLYVQEWRGEGTPRGGGEYRQYWVHLHPPTPIRLPDRETARAEAREFAANISQAPLHLWKATPLPPLHERVAMLVQPPRTQMAWVLKRADGRYEVRYFVYDAMCVRPDGTPFEWEWMRTRWDVATFARDRESALRIGQRELDELISQLNSRWHYLYQACSPSTVP